MEDLYSPVLSDFGIVAVIDEELRRFEEETGCRTKLDKRCAVRPTPVVELTAYRIFREALANIKRHAIGATEVKVSFSDEAEMVNLQVKDNGPGFDVKAVMPNKRLGGLKGMQRRAELGGGTFEVVSSRGHGTTVTVRLPCTSASDGGKEEKTT
jgi:two-component system NarL family sensor kinase